MWSLYKFFIGLIVITWTFRTLSFIIVRSQATKQIFFAESLILVVTLTTYGVGMKWRRFFIYLLPFEFLTIYSTILLGMKIDDYEGAVWNFEKHYHLMLERLGLFLCYIIFNEIYSPSLLFSACTYCPIYTMGALIHSYLRYDMTNEQVFKLNIACIVLFACLGIGFFYMSQMRELSRFFQQQTIIKKEQQMELILNSQSDGIVVVKAVTLAPEAADRAESQRNQSYLEW